jgi:hypothetical protein
MRAHTTNPAPSVTELLGHPDRRYSNRTPILFSVPYSCMSTGQMVIADSVATNLHRVGLAFMTIDRPRPAWTWPSLSTFQERRNHCALLRARPPGLLKSNVVWHWTLTSEEKNRFQLFLGDHIPLSDRDGGIPDHSRNKEVFS